MANNVAAWKAEFYSSILQKVLYQSYVGFYIANTRFEDKFNGNDTVHFSRFDKLTLETLANSYASLTPQDVVLTDETFTLDTLEGGSYEISELDYIEMNVSPDSALITSLRQAYADKFDTKIFAEYSNAAYTADSGTISQWTAGSAAALTKANIYDFITWISLIMDENNIPSNDRWLVVSPKEKRLLANAPELLRSTGLWDRIVTWGFMWEIDWIKIYYSNNLPTVTTTKHALAWAGKPICFASNKKPKITFVSPDVKPDKFTYTVKSYTHYWAHTFTEGSVQLIDVQIAA